MRLQLRFHGRVQGVGFRATAIHCARGLTITGFVRNEPDRSVLMEAQGAQSDLDFLLSRISEHMSRNITRIDRAELPELPDDHAFTITR